MPDAVRDLESTYRKAFEAALIVRHPDPGVVRMEGRDRLDLLHRMSTNDLAGLPPWRLRPTVLTNAIGQTIDLVHVLTREDDLLLLTSPGRAARVRDWLQGYVFFQDEVTLQLEEPAWALWGLYGPEAAAETSSWLPTPPSDTEAVVRFEGGYAWRVAKPVAGLHLLLSPEADASARQRWAGRGGEEADALAYEVLRIEAGLPLPDREILEDTIPLEAGLWEAVSFQKGCYIGQEVIARMESRGRLAKRLAVVRLEGPAEPGAPVVQQGRTVGRLTSVARSPAHGWVGLAMVRPAALETEGGRVRVGEVPGLLSEPLLPQE